MPQVHVNIITEEDSHHNYLSAILPSAKLPPFDEPRIPICPDDPLVQSRSIDVPVDGIVKLNQ